MADAKHKPPELEAVGWFVRTRRTNEDSAGWLIADCSSTPHGAEYARVFAASLTLLDALRFVSENVTLTSAQRAVVERALQKVDLASINVEGC